MATDKSYLPYFKFMPTEWENGNIQIFDRALKGFFADLCSMYWSRRGEVPYALALQKLCKGDESELQALISGDIIGLNNGNIIIEFLDEQLSEFIELAEKRRKAANKRWNDASDMQVHSNSNASREEETKEEESKKPNSKPTIEERKAEFYKLLTPHVEKYGKDLLREFYNYWTEHGPKDRKMKFEKQKSFDPELRLSNWKKREIKFESNGKAKVTWA